MKLSPDQARKRIQSILDDACEAKDLTQAKAESLVERARAIGWDKLAEQVKLGIQMLAFHATLIGDSDESWRTERVANED